MKFIFFVLCAFVSAFSQINYQADHSIIMSYKYGPTIGDHMEQAARIAEQMSRIRTNNYAIEEQERRKRKEHSIKIAAFYKSFKDSVKCSSLIDSTEEQLVLAIGIPDTVTLYGSIKVLSYTVCYYNVYNRIYDFFLKDDKVTYWRYHSF